MLKPKYETLEELLKEVQATRGLDTSIDFIVHVQDLIGHSTYEELHNMSQDYKETFYRVYDEAEGTEATLRFFAEHSKFSMNLQEQLADAEADRDKYKLLYEQEKAVSKDLANKNYDVEVNRGEMKVKNEQQADKIQQLEKELTELKAKLYDLMTA